MRLIILCLISFFILSTPLKGMQHTLSAEHSTIPFFARTAIETIADWASKNKKKTALGVGIGIGSLLWLNPQSREAIRSLWSGVWNAPEPIMPPEPRLTFAYGNLYRLLPAAVEPGRLVPHTSPLETAFLVNPPVPFLHTSRVIPAMPSRPAPLRPGVSLAPNTPISQPSFASSTGINNLLNTPNSSASQDCKSLQDFEHILPPNMNIIQAIQNQYQGHAAAIINRYTKGRALFISRVCEEEQGVLSKDEIGDMVWFFYLYAVYAEGKATQNYKFFEEGTFRFHGNVERIKKLYTILLENPEHYNRASSHYNEQIGRWDHHGIDIENLPPAHMQTILFALLNANDLYIKPEHHGTGAAGIIQHTGGYFASILRKTLTGTARKLAGLFVDMRYDDAEEFRKERVPTDVTEEATFIIKEAEGVLSKQAKSSVADVKMLIKDITTHGLTQIVLKIQDYANNITIQKERPRLHEHIQNVLQKIKEKYPDWEHRKGNEIIFDIDQVCTAPAIG